MEEEQGAKGRVASDRALSASQTTPIVAAHSGNVPRANRCGLALASKVTPIPDVPIMETDRPGSYRRVMKPSRMDGSQMGAGRHEAR